MTNELKDQYRNSRKKDIEALYTIYQGVEESIFLIIAAARIAKDAWEVLPKVYRDANKIHTSNIF